MGLKLLNDNKEKILFLDEIIKKRREQVAIKFNHSIQSKPLTQYKRNEIDPDQSNS